MTAHRASRPARRRPLQLVSLEDRAVPTIFTVTNTADSGAGSLRQAVTDSLVGGPDEIRFDSTVFASPQTISLTSAALPTLTSAGGALTVTGTGAANLTIERSAGAASSFGLFTTAANLTLTNLTLKGARSTTNGGAINVSNTSLITVDGVTFDDNRAVGQGGAIRFSTAGFLNVKNSTFTSNKSTAAGGAIAFFNAGALNIENSTFTGNTGAGTPGGGAIYFFGTASTAPPAGFTPSTVVIRNSTLSNNTITGAPGGAFQGSSLTGTLLIEGSTLSGNSTTTAGGAVNLSGGNLTVRNSTITGNTATTSGGGLSVTGGSGTINLLNSTITGNTATTSGGGLAVTGGTGTINIQNATITGNTANGAAANTGGGGVGRTTTSAGIINVQNSIVAGNTNANGPDVLTNTTGSTVNVNFSAVGSNTGFTLSGTSGNNLAFGTALDLGALADNGGPTLTMAPNAGSPVIDAGSNALVPAGVTRDQRGPGLLRIYSAAGTQTVDIGAFEVQPVGNPIAAATGPNVTTGGAATYTFTVTYSDPLGTNTGLAVGSIQDNSAAIRVTGPNAYSQLATFVSMNNSENGTPRTVTYSVPAPGGTFNAQDNGTYTVAVEANQVFDVDGNPVLPDPVGSFFVDIVNFTVFNTNDTGLGSLRQVLTTAIADTGPNTIDFDPTVFSAATPQTINLQTALPQFTAAGGDLTIVGPGAAAVNIRRDPALPATTEFRVFNSLAPTLRISDLTISGGRVRLDGGGLLAGGTVYLDGVVVRDNVVLPTSATTPADNDGGGIAMVPNSFLSVKNSTVSGNAASRNGGGIYMQNGGSLVVENSTISGNATAGAISTDQFFGGGGIYFYGVVAAAPPAGFTDDTIVIRNSTIANNTSGDSGGGIQLMVFGGHMLIQNTTITGNSAASTVATYGGGGIGVSDSAGSIAITNSIVSGNTSGNDGPDISSPLPLTIDSSAIGDVSDFTYTGANNLIGADLLLGPLANNGGPTQTILPGAGSPALNAGSAALVQPGAATDQRGLGFVRSFGATDLGAVEVQPAGLPYATAAAADVTTAGGTSHTFTVTFTDPTGAPAGIDVASVTANPTTAVRVTGPNGFVGVATLVGVGDPTNGTPRTATYTFTPPGGEWDVLDRGTYSIEVLADTVKDVAGTFVPAGTVGAFTFSVPSFVVLNTDDSGFGSLRQTMVDATRNPGPDTITFDPTVFTGGQTIVLQTPMPQATAAGGDLTIIGPGADALTIRRDPASSLLINFLNSLAPTLSISGLTLSGFDAGFEVGGDGGALVVGGTATLDGMVITGNRSRDDGGGVFVTAGAFLTIRNSTISGNTATGDAGGVGVASNGALAVFNSTISGNAAGLDGGGIYFFSGGALLVDGSTISGNTAAGTSGTGAGAGGIYFFGTALATPPSPVFTPSTVVIRNSTINNNAATAPAAGTFAGGAGGGLNIASFIGTLLLQNSTVAGNTAVGSGGGIAQPSGAGSIRLVNSTVVGNTAGATAANTGGGGIARLSTTAGTVAIQNSIVAGNNNTNGPDILTVAASTVNVNFSAVGNATGYTPSATSGNNLAAGTDLQLGVLADNGGPTRTILPAPTSPLLNAGSNDLVPAGVTADQRGPGYDRVYSDTGTPTVDIGAVEVQPPGVTINQAVAQADPTNAGPILFTVTFSTPVDGFEAADIDFTGSTVGGTLVAEVTPVGPTTYTVSVTGMTGNGTVVASIPAGAATETAAPNAPNRASTSTDNGVTFDTLAPTATIDQGATQPPLTNVAPVVFDVVFSEAVAGFTGADIDFTGSTVGGALVATVTQVTPSTYTVSVTGMTGEGTVVAGIIGGSYADLATNPGAASTGTDNSVDFDDLAPTVTINQGATQGDPTNSTSIVFDVVFSEPVTGFDDADVNLSGGAGLSAVVAPVGGSTTNYTVTVTGMVNNDVVVATVNPGAAQDTATNPSTASTSTDNAVTFDDQGPTVTINQGAAQADPTAAEPIVFDVVFSEDVTGFTAADVILGGTAAGGVATVTGAGAVYTVSVGGMTGTGTVTATIPGAAYTDVAGNPGADSTSTDNEVQFDYGGSFVLEQAAYTVTEDGTSLVVTVSRTGGTEGEATVAFATGGGTAAPGTDYTPTSGTLTFAAGVGGSQTVTIPILDDRVIELVADTFDVTLSNPTNATAVVRLGTPGTATVTITDIEEGQFNFSAPVFTEAEVLPNGEPAFATITVTRTNGTAGAVSVSYAAVPGTAHAGGAAATGQDDFTPVTGTLDFLAGETSRTFTIPLLNDTFNEGRELIALSLTTPSGNTIIGTQGTAAAAILPSDGTTLTPRGVLNTDTDGDVATIKLSSGTGVYYRADPDGDTKGPIELVEVSGTTELTKSALSITVKKPLGSVDPDAGKIGLGAVTGTTLKAIAAKAAYLTGDGINLTGYLGSLTIGDVLGGADIITGASANVTTKTNITAGVIAAGTAIAVAGPIGKLTATKVGAGTITAPRIGAVIVKGATRPAVIAGDFGSTVTVSGAGVPAGKPALGKVTVAGSVLAGADFAAPSIGSITAKGDFAADITVSGVGMTAGKPVLGKLTVGRTLTGSTIAAAAAPLPPVGTVSPTITGVTAGAVVNTTIAANSLGSLRVVGARAKGLLPALAGDVTNLDLTLAGDGVPATRPTLGTFAVSGTVLDSDIAVGGNVTAVSALNFRGSNFYVGFTGTEAGVGAFLPTATLKAFTVKGVTDAFADSNVIASTLGTVTLKSVDADNTENGGAAFGFISDTIIKSLKVTTPLPAFVYNPFNVAPQGIGPDFEIRLV